MRKFSLLAVVVILMTSCEKESLSPSKPNPKEQLKECKMCEGGWDITDSIP